MGSPILSGGTPESAGSGDNCPSGPSGGRMSAAVSSSLSVVSSAEGGVGGGEVSL